MSVASPSDPDLLRRCLEGEEAAWLVLTERYADLVYGVARRSGLGADLAGDVVQEVFLALYRQLARLRHKDRLVGWLAQTARRESWRLAKRQRARSRREAVRAGENPGPVVRLPQEALEALEEEHAVRASLARLTERCRRLLDLLFFAPEVRSYAEIAAELSMPVGSLGPTRARCLDALRQALLENGFPPPDATLSQEVSRQARASSGRSRRATP